MKGVILYGSGRFKRVDVTESILADIFLKTPVSAVSTTSCITDSNRDVSVLFQYNLIKSRLGLNNQR